MTAALPDPLALLDPYARALLRSALARLPHPAVLPRQQPLHAALQRFAAPPQDGSGGDTAGLRAALLATAPGLAPHVALLEHCVARLATVLSGEMAATEVLFPGGSTALVRPIYRDNPWSDHFNALTARATARAVGALLPTLAAGERVRVLEVGAGTGGTSAAVLRALDRYGAQLSYQYTDVSAGFVQHGQQHFAPGRPYLTCRVLDLEADLTGQGQEAASQHLVLATNVLHATADVAATMQRLAWVLRPGGLLLLNELTRTGAFATATFGLLDGWWAFRDAERRQPDSPLLSVASWTRVLGEQGFGRPGVFGLSTPPEKSFQCLLVAERTRDAVARPAGPAMAQEPPPGPPASAVPDPAIHDRALLDWVAGRLSAQLAAVLGLHEDELPHDRPFAELGVDSIVAPQLAAAANAALGTALAATDVFNHATVAALAAHVIQLARPAAEAALHRATGTQAAPPERPAHETTRPQAAAERDIAIVGMACRFPGAPDADAFWRMIVEGGSAIQSVPAERWDWRALHAPDRQPGRLYAQWGGFLEDHDRFDPEFFHLSWREAGMMSPQQRVFLQVAWHALEDAGYPAPRLSGLSCGVFVGVTHRDHAAQNGESLPALGNSVAILPARLSYLLNLRGPSVPVDTACSSSLVAVHMGCQSLLSGDSDIVVAGGVSVLLTDPSLHLFLSDSGMASPTGACHAFDAAADGFVPGEGAGAVVLKRLADASRDGDRVLGVIKASGINQDGRTSGITAPSGPAQTALQRLVHARGGIDPATIGYVEAHGTGTALGDPIEVGALIEAFGEGCPARGCALGSVKANIGHTLTAAGVAGLIKVLLSFRAGVIPPTARFSTLNPRIDLAGSPFHVPVTALPWREGLRRAAVSSFGFSGTNAHLVVEAPAPEMVTAPADVAGGVPILLSAGTPDALDRRVADLRLWLDTRASSLTDLAYTLAAGRTQFDVRLALVAHSLDALRAALATISARGDVLGCWRGEAGTAANRAAASAALAQALGTGADAARLAALWASGGDGDWSAAFPGARRIAAPLYPFARARFARDAPHSLLGAGSGPVWPIRLDAGAFPLADHRLDGRPLLPAAAYLDAVVAAALRSARVALPCRVSDVEFLRPLYATADATLALTDQADGCAFEVSSGTALHARGRLTIADPAAVPGLSRPAGGIEMSGAAVYDRFAAMGFTYGPGLQAIRRLHAAGEEVVAELAMPAAVPQDGFVLHPALLDGAIQSAIGLVAAGAVLPRRVVPVGLAGLAVYRPVTGDCRAHVRRTVAPDGAELLHITLRDPAGELLAHLDGLALRVERTTELRYYEPVWQPVAGPARPPALLFDAGEALWDRLDRAPVLVEPGEHFGQTGPRRFTVAPDSLDHHQRLLAAVGPATTIWHCWGRHSTPRPLEHGVYAVAQLARALLRSDRQEPVRLVHAHDGSPFGRMVAGLGRALDREQSTIRLASVESGDPAMLLHAEAQVAQWRELPRAGGTSVLRRGGVYVISGGLGGIGTVLARHLVRAWDARLILLGRSVPDERHRVALRAIGDAAERQVIYRAADITDAAALRTALADGRARFGPIQGVIHAAGVQRDGLLRDKPEAAMRAVVEAKVLGAGALDAQTASDPLEFFASFSSVAAACGSRGQAEYAAANAFLDAHAAARQGPGVSVSIGWPFWRAGGMWAGGAEDARGAHTGIRPLDEAEGCAAFEAALALGRPHVLPLAGDAGRIQRFLAEMSKSESAPMKPGGGGDMLGYVRGVFSKVLGMPLERLDSDRALDRYGIDSIRITELTAMLEADFGTLPKTLLFEHATMRSLATHLDASGIALPAARPSAAVAQTPPAAAEGIAIIGIAGRFPEAGSLEAFWDNLNLGRDCIREIPPDRWDATRLGSGYARWGGFLPDVARFDPLFFNIAPQEAERMDPQERLFLEVCWEAMENAGYTRAELAGTDRAGAVFVGTMYGDYALRVADQHLRGNPVAGASPYWSIANRVSYVFDLHGPSMAVDTACSSSLTAIQLACQALSAGECRVAIAGGVNLSLHPLKHVGLSQAHFAATDGRCRSFAEGGDGYVPGEGVGAVILKPLAAALADGDHVHAVIRGWAANHGGKTNGYTVPSPIRQAEVIRAAMARAKLEPQSVSYVEAHGTGTALGDPIEIAGLASAYGSAVPLQSVRLASAKASIGHLEAAAGVAGLAKVVLQMRHRRFVPMPAFGGPNPNIDFAATPFRLQHAAEPWEGPLPLRAGISSFGAGGANAHLVVEAGPPSPAPGADAPAVLVLSARTRQDLQDYARRLADALPGSPFGLVDICHTLQHGREAMAARLACVVTSKAMLSDRLRGFVAGQDAACHVHVRDDDDASAAPVPAGAALDAVAAAWVRGADVAWPVLGRRVPLPPHPFAGARYWILENATETPAQPHPALDQVLPSLDGALFARHVAVSDRLVRDHAIAGDALLPGAVQIEMILAAAQLVDPGAEAVCDLVWQAPVKVPASGVDLRILLRRQEGGLGCEVRSTAGLLYTRARIGGAAAEPSPPVPATAEWAVLGRAAIYAAYESLGVRYGPSLALLTEIRTQGDTVVARLETRAAVVAEAAWIDAAMQSLLGLLPKGERRLHVPFALAAVRRFAPLDTARLVVGRRREGEAGSALFDLSIRDAGGVELMRLSGLATRPLGLSAALTTAIPCWRRAPAPARPLATETTVVSSAREMAAASGAHIVWRATEPAGEVAATAEAMALDLLAGLQALHRAGRLREPLRLTVVTRTTQPVDPADHVDPRAAAMLGVAKVAALEFPALSVALVDMDDAALARPDWLHAAAAEPCTAPAAQIAWRGARRYVLALQPAALNPAAGGLPTLPAGAVWLVVGGGGGLGLALTDWLVRQHRARVALVGRRPADAALQARLAAIGGEVAYFQADATDTSALAGAAAQVCGRWGRIDAAVQAALVLQDAPLAAMDAAMFRAALAPKVAASVALEAALAGQDLRLLVLFSSANAFPGAAGQANYVAGSCFADAWASGLPRRRGWHNVTVNWGLWGEVGAVRAAPVQDRLARIGVHPIQPAEGLDVFGRILASGERTVVAVKAEPEALRQLGVAVDPIAQAAVLGPTPGLAAALHGLSAIERGGLRRLRDVLLAMSADAPGRRRTPGGLAKRLGIAPRHGMLLPRLLEALAVAGLAVCRDGLWAFPEPVAAAAAAPDQEAPFLAASRRLLQTCLDHYSDLLRGRRDPVDVLFPDASPALVQAAYDGNPAGERINAGMGAVAAAQAGALLAAGAAKVRVLEVGAGTGSSTASVLQALAPHAGRIDYIYTDISPRFLAHGEQRFTGGFPGMRFALFDAERDTAVAGEEPGGFDVVLAANVLHATAGLQATIGRMRGLLRPGGVLVVNELTAARDFATMVFGLTEGWWRGAGEAGRMPGTPLAGAAQWSDWLLEAGFASVHVDTPAEDGAVAPQSLIVAVAPGDAALPTAAPAKPEQVPIPLDAPYAAPDGLLAHLRGLFAAVLRVEPSEMRLHEPFDRYGLESLSALDIRNRLEPDFPAIPPTLLFEHPTLAKLVDHLQARFPQEAARFRAVSDAPAAAAPPRPAEPGEQPIAIIGFSARLPGGADPAAFWSLLHGGGQAIREVPADRWDVAAHFDPAGGEGQAYTKWGGFIDEVDRFDPLFFRISPLEAESMDPQERLFLQTAWATLEAAGTTPARLSAAAPQGVGVFVGVMNTPYQWLAAEAWRDGHAGAGASHAWSVANRVSYLLDLTGPSLAVDTACSASLTAVHLACESLRRGECGAAIAGGVNLILHPRQMANLSAARMLASGAECRAFASGADGFVDGEGVGAVLLKPLAAALRDGDRIEGVILGSAINAGGRTAGFTVPSPDAQAAVVRQALARAAIPAESIGHVETHGTGTALGDPIEVAGLRLALDGPGRPRCTLGALKANIGHLESAAGIAGLVKLLLQLRHGTVAPHPFAAAPSPMIDFAATCFVLPSSPAPWLGTPRGDGSHYPCRAGLSSFGAGGANAHLILQEPPVSPAVPHRPASPELVPLSARDELALARVARRLADALAAEPPLLLADIAHTLRLGRVALDRRAVLVVSTTADLAAALRVLADGQADERVLRGGPAEPWALALAETPEGRTRIAAHLAARDLPALAELWCRGADIDWAGLPLEGQPRPVELPTYPFARDRHFLPRATPHAEVPSPRPPAPETMPRPRTDLHLLGRTWRAAPMPAEARAPGTLLCIAPEGFPADAVQSVWPGPAMRATAEEAATLLAGMDGPVSVLQAGDWTEEGGLAPTLALARAFHARGADAVRLLHLHHLDAGAMRPFAAAMGGFARSAGTELAGVGMRTITVEGPWSPASLTTIVRAEARASDAAVEILYRGSSRHLPVLTRIAPDGAGIGFREQGAYLIGGGLGEVGMALAQALVRRFRARIAILGRRPAADGVVAQRLDRLREQGALVCYEQADIADPARLRPALARLRRQMGTLHGVLQMATDPADGLIGAKTADAAARVLRPKIEGTLALDAALRDETLDWFVAFTSVAGWQGLAGGADYAYASAWQSHFAGLRQAMVERGERHGRSLAIAWPQWRYDRHLHADKLRLLQRSGLDSIDAEDGLALIEIALCTRHTDLLALRAGEGALEELVASYDRAAKAPPGDIAAELAEMGTSELLRYVAHLRDREASPSSQPRQTTEQGGATRQEIAAVVCAYLKLAPEQVGVEARFDTFGLDSIKALHVAERLSRRFARQIDPAMFYEHPTVARLAAAIDAMAVGSRPVGHAAALQVPS